jgi:hypothetical protein
MRRTTRASSPAMQPAEKSTPSMWTSRKGSVAPDGNHVFTHQAYGLVISMIFVGYAAYEVNSARVADRSGLAKITTSNFE